MNHFSCTYIHSPTDSLYKNYFYVTQSHILYPYSHCGSKKNTQNKKIPTFHNWSMSGFMHFYLLFVGIKNYVKSYTVNIRVRAFLIFVFFCYTVRSTKKNVTFFVWKLMLFLIFLFIIMTWCIICRATTNQLSLNRQWFCCMFSLEFSLIFHFSSTLYIKREERIKIWSDKKKKVYNG
jgi:hypothetical protein